MPRGTKKPVGNGTDTSAFLPTAPANTTKVTLTLSKELYALAQEVADHPDEERTVPQVLIRILRKAVVAKHNQLFTPLFTPIPAASPRTADEDEADLTDVEQ